MSRLRALAWRVKGALTGRTAADDQLDDEIRHHLELQAEEYVRAGMAPEEARLAARRRFGGVEQVKERYRDQRGLPAVETLARDVRYSLRLLRRSPAFSFLAVATLALGIGSATAIFSLLNRALLRPLPVDRPGELVALNNVAANRPFPTFSYPNFLDLRTRVPAFAGLIAYRFAPLSVSHEGINERLWGYLISGNYFDVLGVGAALGRTIGPGDDLVRGGQAVVVVSHRFWQQRLGGAGDALGRGILVNGRTYTIVGVAPRGFFGTEVVSAPDMWFPLVMQAELEGGNSWLDDRRAENLFVIGRLGPGVTVDQASAVVAAAAGQLAAEYPDVNEGRSVSLSPPGLIGSAMRGPVLGFTGLLLLVAGLVLLLACINLANLLLARAIDRRREMAVRLSLGAGRFRLVRQLLTESLLLSAAAGLVGLLLAAWFVDLAMAFKIPVDLPLAVDLTLDLRVLLFTIALAAATGVLFGLVPALQATNTDLVGALKEGTASGYRHDPLWKKALIVAQVAISLVLLVGGGLMVRALARVQAVPLGFTADGAGEVSFDLRLQGYSAEAGRGFQRNLLERVRALPGIRAAALADLIPVDLHFARARMYAEGVLPERGARAPLTFTSRVSPGYFEAMGTRLVQGRDFTAFDLDGSTPVVIVNQALVRRLWRGEEPLGRRLSLNGPDAPLLQVIGVAEDGKYAGFNEDPQPMVYRPLLQSYSGSTTVVVRAAGSIGGALALVRREVLSLDPHIPIASARTLSERLAVPLFPARVVAAVLGVFGILALALAAIGLYGVMSYMVSTRTHEFGVRMALGARANDVLALVLRQGLTLTAAGLAAGVALAIVVARLMRAVLFGISSTDAPTYATVVVVLAVVALLACLVPARRATRLDPLDALRAE